MSVPTTYTFMEKLRKISQNYHQIPFPDKSLAFRLYIVSIIPTHYENKPIQIYWKFYN